MIIILLSGRTPIRFHSNLCGSHWAPVTEDRASRFNSETEARIAMVDYGLRGQAVEFRKLQQKEKAQ